MDSFVIRWNVGTSSYPAKSFSGQRVTYVGPLNPAELGNEFNVGIDIWSCQAQEPDLTVNIDSTNIANLQTLVNAAASNTRFLFKASAANTPTVYEGVGNIEFVLNRPVQFVGELGSQGQRLITLNGSQVITSFTLVSGKYRATVPAIVGSLPTNTNEGLPGFYPGLEGQVWVNDVPYNPVLSTAGMLTSTDFYYDDTNNYIYLNFNPAGSTIRFGVYNNFCSAGNTGTNGRVTKGANNVVVMNLEFTQYCGNRNGSVIGKRGGVYSTTDLPMFFWAVQNCRVYNCRGDAVYIPQKSLCQGLISENNGRGSIRGGERTDASYDAGYTTTVYTIFQGNRCSYNNWAGNNGGDSNKMYQSYFCKVIDSEYSGNGYTSRGLEIECNGLWFDVCANLIIQNNRIFNNYAHGLFIEISFTGLIEYNQIFDNVLGDVGSNNWSDIYNSTSKGMEYRYNRINSYSNAGNSVASRPFHLMDDDRGTDNQFGFRESADVSFHDNIIVYKGTNGQFQINYDKIPVPSPEYRGYTGKNITIYDNTYLYPVGSTANRWRTNTQNFALAQVQAFVDSNSAPFNWEQGSTINAY